MKPRDWLRLVVMNLRRTRGRASMSALGVLIGTAAIVILVSLAAGLQQSANASLSSIGPLNEITLLGGSTLQALSGVPSGGADTRLTPSTLADIAGMPGVVAVTPREPLAAGSTLQLNRLVSVASVTGIDARVVRQLGWEVASGVLRLGRQQALVGARVGDFLADPRRPGQTVDPVDLQGQTLKLSVTRVSEEGTTSQRVVRLRVAGVLAERGGQDDYTVFLALPDVDELNAWATGQRPQHDRAGYAQATVVLAVANQVLPLQNQLLTRGFLAFSASGTLAQLNIFFLVIQAIMGGVGGIALLVAGIGIANTLTMAILERTREIGLMKAVGATNRDVMGVFLGEAGAIATLGGLGGLVAGWGVCRLINLIAGVYISAQTISAGATAAPAVPDVAYTPWWLPAAVLLFAAGLGVLSGIYPAQRAVLLNPVVALKHE
jgi:putative ABC transport system permease protein